MNNFLQIQPHTCRQPLENKVVHLGPWELSHGFDRVMFLDPTGIYDRIAYRLDPFARHQGGVDFKVLFPKTDNRKCGCGCGFDIPPRASRWARPSCGEYASVVYKIIYGDTKLIYQFLALYYGETCANCKRDSGRIYREDIKPLPIGNHLRTLAALSVDHILAVKLGGGGGWFSNYQLLCNRCHLAKTQGDVKAMKLQGVKKLL